MEQYNDYRFWFDRANEVAKQIEVIRHYLNVVNRALKPEGNAHYNFESVTEISIDRALNSLKFELGALEKIIPPAIDEFRNNKYQTWAKK